MDRMSATSLGRLSADVAIIGSGFAGSLTALCLRSIGRSVVLLERGRHPRFAIGESSTPLANLLLEELCDRYGLESVRPLSKWGTWQDRYPHLGCGLKRGFSFFHHDFDEPFHDTVNHERQLLVAASPHDRIADTHWYRPDVDQFLAQEATSAGAEYVDDLELTAIDEGPARTLIAGRRGTRNLQIEARFVVDASGPRGFLHRVLRLGERPFKWLPPTQALFTHFTGVDRWDGGSGPPSGPPPPFPVDDAALHHVFPGGWIWILRFSNGITSAGAALTDAIANSIDIGRDGAWERLLARLPSIADRFRSARAARPFLHSPRLAFRSAAVTGARWALLPSAAGVIDPLLSTGFPLTLLGIHRLLRLLEADSWEGAAFAEGLADCADRTERELEATGQLVAALYASMHDFEQFKRLSLLYFAAASFSETARRAGVPERAPGFLLCDDPLFGPESRGCADAVLSAGSDTARDAVLKRIDRAIAPFDVAGFGDRRRVDWYPVLASDLLAAASKLDVAPQQIDRLLERCGFASDSPLGART